jgi:hypothetical protein
MRVLALASLAFFAIAPAYAQGPNFGDGKKKDTDQKVEAARRADEDKAYKSSLQRIPPKAGNIDPWGDVRSGDGPPSPQGGAKKPNAANTAR